MYNRRIEKAKKGYIFYCSECKKEYENVGFFIPIEGCEEYFHCIKCGNTYPGKNIKLRRKIIDYCSIV